MEITPEKLVIFDFPHITIRIPAGR
uniref:Uncharacterized protein n=1 Tax=Rhizophora mucronata TaxID=61149 RepID=A0A2P2MZM4_RHIMU